MPHRFTAPCLALAAAIAGGCATDAREAQCQTADEGVYACRVEVTDELGSFEVTAPGRPTYTLVVETPGVAYGFVDLGVGAVPQPGRFLRVAEDPACWENTVTETRLCVR